MNELTKEELEEQENKLREKRETQDCINCIILLILFIIQGIVLPIIYTNHQSIWGITHIKMVCIVSVCYYTLKQIFLVKQMALNICDCLCLYQCYGS